MGFWMAIGALLHLAFFVAFLYTDAALVLASETSVFSKSGLPLPLVPELLRSTTYPLIIAFLVSLLAVGIISDDRKIRKISRLPGKRMRAKE